MLKILADKTRLAILEQLMEQSKHVSDFGAELQIEQSLLSHHLKILREAGLVTSKRDGKSVLYSIAPEAKTSTSKKGVNLGCCILSFN